MRSRDGRRRPAVLSFLHVALGAVLFVAVNIVADGTLRGLRLDLTEERRYTISDGTINVIGSLEEPIRLKLYFSRRLARQVPVVMDYGRRVQELLERYVQSSRGMIRLEVIDPEPLGESEDEADLAGLRPVPLDTGTRLYFGLVGTNTTGGREVVPFLRVVLPVDPDAAVRRGGPQRLRQPVPCFRPVRDRGREAPPRPFDRRDQAGEGVPSVDGGAGMVDDQERAAVDGQLADGDRRRRRPAGSGRAAHHDRSGVAPARLGSGLPLVVTLQVAALAQREEPPAVSALFRERARAARLVDVPRRKAQDFGAEERRLKGVVPLFASLRRDRHAVPPHRARSRNGTCVLSL